MRQLCYPDRYRSLVSNLRSILFTSRMLSPRVGKRTLKHGSRCSKGSPNKNLQDIIAILGMDEFSESPNKLTVARARKIQRFLSHSPSMLRRFSPVCLVTTLN